MLSLLYVVILPSLHWLSLFVLACDLSWQPRLYSQAVLKDVKLIQMQLKIHSHAITPKNNIVVIHNIVEEKNI